MNYTANLPSIVEEGMVFYLVPPQIDVPRILHLTYFKEDTFHSASVEFAEIDSIDLAERVLGCHLLIEDSDVIDSHFFEPTGLIGLRVEDSKLGSLGLVNDLVDNGFQQLIVVKPDNEGTPEIMIPLVDEFIDSVEDGVLRTTCPPGLLDVRS